MCTRYPEAITTDRLGPFKLEVFPDEWMDGNPLTEYSDCPITFKGDGACGWFERGSMDAESFAEYAEHPAYFIAWVGGSSDRHSNLHVGDEEGAYGAVAYIRKDKYVKYYGLAATEENFVKAVTSYLDEINNICNGEVYCYKITKGDDELVDDCYGFVGDLKYCREDGLAALTREHAAWLAKTQALADDMCEVLSAWI